MLAHNQWTVVPRAGNVTSCLYLERTNDNSCLHGVVDERPAVGNMEGEGLLHGSQVPAGSQAEMHRLGLHASSISPHSNDDDMVKGAKRPADDDGGMRSSKMRREVCRDSSVGSLPLTTTILRSSPEAISSFDLKSLTGVLEAQEFVARDVQESALTDVHVPGATSVVSMSSQLMLRQIIDRLNLTVYDFGIADEAESGIRGWIDLDIPVLDVDVARKRQKFMGDAASCRYNAMESACKAAVQHMRMSGAVCVKDASHAELKMLESRAVRAESFMSMYFDKIGSMKKREAAMLLRYDSVFAAAKHLCKEFKDILPVATVDVVGPTTIPGAVKVMYAGPTPPLTRIDEFMFAFVSVLNRGSEIGPSFTMMM